jgi:microsomal dipeptidase-like Zn-dependent dipeptidase
MKKAIDLRARESERTRTSKFTYLHPATFLALLLCALPLTSYGQLEPRFPAKLPADETDDERKKQVIEAMKERPRFDVDQMRDNLRRQNLDYEIWQVGTPNAANELSYGMDLVVGVGVRVLGAAAEDRVVFYAGVAQRGSNEAVALSERFEGQGPGPHLLQVRVPVTESLMRSGRFDGDVILLGEKTMPGLPGREIVLKRFLEDKDPSNHRERLTREVVRPEISFARVGKMGSSQTVEVGDLIELKITARMQGGGPARQGISFVVGDPDSGRIDAMGPKVFRRGDGDFPEATMRVRVQPEQVEDGKFKTTLFVLRDSEPSEPFESRLLRDSNPGDNRMAIVYNVREGASNRAIEGYVLTHEHPTYGMAFGGNFAFAGKDGNYRNGIMEDGYTAECGGCKVLGNCDHGEVKGSFIGPSDALGKDIGDHKSHMGPLKDSNSHLRYSTEWTREAFSPSEPVYRDARMRIMVAFAVENEAMCEQLYYANKGNGGPGGDGYACSSGDSYASLKRQLDNLKLWAEENSNWMEIAYSASDARRIVNEDKLAIILGVEAEYAFGAENRTFDPVERLSKYYDEGVRTFYLAHKINSRLAGADIYFPADSNPGKAVRTAQAIAGCFYYDDNVGHFPLEGRLGKKLCDNLNSCGANAFKGGKITDSCAYKLSDISEVNMTDYILTRGGGQFNGFALYPETPGFSTKGGSRTDNRGVERNNLGLAYEGERVVRAAMLKGMIVNIDHVSNRARDDIYELATKEFNNYPLNALHNKPNRMLSNAKGFKEHEYDLDDDELEYIKRTGGFFGFRMGPTDSQEFPKSGISGASKNCPKTSTESAKMLAYLVDFGLPVGYALDYATNTQGVFSRTVEDCGTDAGDEIHYYIESEPVARKHVAEGISHIGMMKQWHKELETIGLKREYLDKLKYAGVEAFLRMWEKSEAASDSGKQVQRIVITPTVKPH